MTTGDRSDPRVVDRSIQLDGDPQRAWDAWTDPILIAGWFVDEAVGRPVTGGRVVWRWEKFGFEAVYDILDATAPRRLVLRTSGRTDDAAVIEVSLGPANGGTLLRVVQSGFGPSPPGADVVEGIASGWTLALAQLRFYLEHAFGRPKVDVLVLKPVASDCVAAGRLYESDQGLADLAGSGRVLAATRTERLREWPAIGGTLEYKAFTARPGECMAGLRAVSWSRTQSELDILQPKLEASVDRIVRALE